MNEYVDESTYKNHFFDSTRALSSVKSVVSNFKHNIIKTGFSFIDNYTMGLFRGDVIFWIARPGNFKTCVASGVLQNVAATTGKKCLFFSMEMNLKDFL